jgi:hypothetical protein
VVGNPHHSGGSGVVTDLRTPVFGLDRTIVTVQIKTGQSEAGDS